MIVVDGLDSPDVPAAGRLVDHTAADVAAAGTLCSHHNLNKQLVCRTVTNHNLSALLVRVHSFFPQVECFWLSDTLPVGSPFCTTAATASASISRSSSLQITKAALPAMPPPAPPLRLHPANSGSGLSPVTSGSYGHLTTGSSLGAKASGLLLEEAVAKLRLAQSMQTSSAVAGEALW